MLVAHQMPGGRAGGRGRGDTSWRHQNADCHHQAGPFWIFLLKVSTGNFVAPRKRSVVNVCSHTKET